MGTRNQAVTVYTDITVRSGHELKSKQLFLAYNKTSDLVANKSEAWLWND